MDPNISAEADPFARQHATTTEVNVHSIVDAFWLSAVAERGYSEYAFAQRITGLDEVDEHTLDALLPDDSRIIRRSFFTNARRQEAVVEFEDTLVTIDIRAQHVWMGVAARDIDTAIAVLERFDEAFPTREPPSDADPEVPVVIWTQAGAEQSRGRSKPFPAVPWDESGSSYAPGTAAAFEPLLDFTPGGTGRLLLWHGVPGSGKTTALGTLAWAWREWCAVHYVVDPEAFLNDPEYLLSVLLENGTFGRPWKLVVLEDTGELLSPQAKSHTGQGLSRLLNVTDGFLGQGSETLLLITTNEPLESLHEAVARPGRCIAAVEFEALPIDQARKWLCDRGAAEAAERVSGAMTLAELYRVLQGGEAPPARHPLGFRVA